MKIERIEGGSDIDVKRFYFPYKVTSRCPTCGVDTVRDGTEDYVSFIGLGCVEELGFYRECAQEDHKECEWTERVVFDLTLRPAEDSE